MKKWIIISVVALLLVGAGFVSVKWYSYVFAKSVDGEILKVERVTQPEAIIGSNVPSAQVFSFAIAIRDKKGEIHTASSEDRQWAVAEKGQCVEAKFYPYAPWQLDKAGTYFGARLMRLYACTGEAAK